MPGRLPDGLVNRIKIYLDLDRPIGEIVERTKVSRSTIFRIRLNLDVFGTPYPPRTVKLGRPRSLL